MANTSLRLSASDEETLQHLQGKLGANNRTQVIRLALVELGREIARREQRAEDLVRRLEQYLPAFTHEVVDEVGFDDRRERAFARVDDLVYVDADTRMIFAERRLEDGTIQQTRVERGGENEAARIEIGPAQFVE